MKTNEALALIDDADFLDKIYRFSYRRCNTSVEAEDLCSDIILAVLSAVHKQSEITNFYPFVWTVAHRVYADFCEKRKKHSQNTSIENTESPLISPHNEIDALIEESATAQQLQKIYEEITFLSKAYREVMVMYYIDDCKVKNIASHLGISETTVKQRLFSARNTVRKEVETMNNRNLSLKPIRLYMQGGGNIGGNDPRKRLERIFSQNLVYLCKDKPRTAKELSEELCVPMPFVEEELEIQCRGESGNFGALRKLENGKYIANMLIVDYEEFDAATEIYQQLVPAFCAYLRDTLQKNKEKILKAPFLSPQKDIRFILWAWINFLTYGWIEAINSDIEHNYFPDIIPTQRDYCFAGIAYPDGTTPDFGGYSCDSINAPYIDGYTSVEIYNLYGKWMDGHFDAGHSIVHDPKLRMLIRSIGGLSIKTLTDDEKEIVAKAIECGYLRKSGTYVEPNIVVLNQNSTMELVSHLLGLDSFQENESCDIMEKIPQELSDAITTIAKELSEFIKKHIPGHLMNEYMTYAKLIAGSRLVPQIIEECIKKGLLYEPENRIGGEGVLMFVE